MTLPKTSCEAEINYSKLSITKKNRSSMIEERMNYLPILSIENYITNSLSYEEAIKAHAAPKM